MKSKLTISLFMALMVFIASCTKDEFNERDAIDAQKELLNLKYQHELDLETLKQKGATALQQLLNAAALEQLKLNDSLATKSAIAAKKQDYSVTVVDVTTNVPIADADVTVSSEGKVYSAKTNTSGIATFNSLYLFPTSAFLISKTGYAATQILQQYITTGPAKLWNPSDLSNEITGTLFIETDLTNLSPEKVGANVLVTASTTIPTGTVGSYNVYYPSYTIADGSYSIKVPAAPNGYNLNFEQVIADQKLYVNATDDDPVTTFPAALPRIEKIKTYYKVNSYSATVPYVYNYYYFKFAPDKAGRTLYSPGFSNSYGYGQVFTSANNGQFQVEKISSYNYYNYYPNGSLYDLNLFIYEPNTKVDVELVDITGTLIATAPKLSAQIGSNGKLMSYSSPEGGSGFIHLRRDANGTLVPDAKGVLTKSGPFDSFTNLYSLNFTGAVNTTSNRTYINNFLLPTKGDKKVVNFYYGSGESRIKQVY